METILITGGAGFIGSHLSRWCIDRGYKVIVVDNCSTGDVKNIHPDAIFFRSDITDPDLYEKLSEFSIQSVFHLAAQSSGEVSHNNPVEDIRINTLGTVQILEFCKKNRIERFLYASSMAIYGNPEYNPVNESNYPNPESFYGLSKLCSEQYIQHYYYSGIKTTIFRMFSVYGPGQNLLNLKQGMVSIFLAYLLNNEPLLIKGSLERFRDFIYIDDICSAWIEALDNEASYGKTYNLGTGIKTRVDELVSSLFSVMDLDPNTYTVKICGNTPDDQFGLFADIDCISKDLKWKPVNTLSMGLEKMVKWAQSAK